MITMKNQFSIYTPRSEHFFFAPLTRKIVHKNTVTSSGRPQFQQRAYSFEHSPEIVLFWCEYNDGVLVKSYPVKLLNRPDHQFDVENRTPYYHLVSDTVFEQASAEVLKDLKNDINLLYTYVRPDMVSEDLLIVPEQAMQYLTYVFSNKK